MQKKTSTWMDTVERSSWHHATKRSTTCLPLQLSENIPSCALSCIEEFVQTQYSSASCFATSQLTFLCTQSTPSGFTIGEASLQCLVSDCTDTSSEEGTLYNICSTVANAVPETMATITATIAPSPNSASTNAPPSTTSLLSSISIPSSLQSVVTIVTTSGTPSVPTTSPVYTTFSTTSPSSSSSTTTTLETSVQANPDSASTSIPASAKVHSGLSTGQIAGIAVSVVSVSVVFFVILLCLFCIRKKRKNVRPLSTRWSAAAYPHPPPVGDRQHSQATRNVTPNFVPNTRYYATAPVGEKRRSFWRKSITHHEIGVAVSPEVRQQGTPESTSSHDTADKLLPALPAPTLWPASLKKRPANTGIGFQEVTGGLGFNTDFQGPAAPYETRVVSRPPQSSLGAFAIINSQTQVYNAGRSRPVKLTGKIPLTPVYDNGNYGAYHPGGPQYQWAPPQPSTRSLIPPPPPLPQGGVPIPRGLYIRPTAMKQIVRTSAASESTMFDEDTTPEEDTDRQLRLAQSTTNQAQLDLAIRDSSPIKNLAYPPIPRPAAVSRQVHRVARPIPSTESVTSLAQRRAEQSRAGQQKDLRIKTANPVAVALNQRWEVQPRVQLPPQTPDSLYPPPRATTSPTSRLTPKANARGDLYLTVED